MPSNKSCDDLGVCQNRTPACAECANYIAHERYPFAPGTISQGWEELQVEDAGWLLETHWTDWVAGVALLATIGLICGWIA